MRKLLLYIVLLITVLTCVVQQVSADSLSVTATVGDTALTIQGYTSPNSLVTFMENDVVKGTTMSLSDGSFEKTFPVQDPGAHTVSFFATDPRGDLTYTVNQSFILIQSQTLTLSDIYLPPTIRVDKSTFTKGDTVDIDGYSKPSSMINITLTGPTGSLKAASTNSAGYYKSEISSSSFSSGSYTAVTTLQVNFSNTSTDSQAVSFSLADSATVTSTPGPTTTTTPIPSFTPTPTPNPCPYTYVNLCFFDSQKKGTIDVVKDLKNFIVGFIEHFSQPINTVFDINNDGVVNAQDLSIVLFHTNAKPYQVLGLSTQQSGNSSVLGLSTPQFAIPSGIQDNGIMNFFMQMIVIELVIGIPFFIVFIILTVITRRYEKKSKN